MKNIVEYFFVVVLKSIILLFPFRTVQIMGKAFGSFIFYCIPIRKNLVLSNLRHAFPDKPEKEIADIAHKNFQSIFITFFETFCIQRLSEKEVHDIVKISDIKIIDDLLQKKKGLIMLSGHISSWEFIALAVGLITKHPLQIIIKKQHNPYVDRLMNSLRTKFNNQVVEMDKAPREILRRIRENGVVAMLADQSGPEEGVFINYFGRPTSTHVGPAVFCLRTGAPVVMTYAVRRNDGKFDVMFEEVLTDQLIGSDDEKIRTLTERHVRMLEKYVKMYPDQWLWMHNRWKHTEKYLSKLKEQQLT